MKIHARRSFYQAQLGEWPKAALPPTWFAQEPFAVFAENPLLSASLQESIAGVVRGHNTMMDSGFWDACEVQREVPLSPLFARDLAGRAIYLGYGPEIKDNDEWEAYRPPLNPDGSIPPELFNPYVPFVCFPRHCRDVAAMPGAELLEEVLFCHFRPLEMPVRSGVLPSGADADDNADRELLIPTYNSPNLYPYKLRLDTFYPDGYRLPQTQMLFARGIAQGVDLARAQELGQGLLKNWQDREPGTSYQDWLSALGEHELEHLFQRGCTLIPTFEAHNGVAVVGRNFELQDYWPGRAVIGLHEITDMRPDQAPRGTILQVLTPGYITATRVVTAQVIVSDGSGYVSPNAMDPLPLIPNLNLPHSRTAPNWRGCHLPTHPQHFELPALWGWEPESGKFLQISGPLWAPLYYFYGCTDLIIDSYDFPQPWDEENPALTPVPLELKGRFWPMIPMPGFDSFSLMAENERTRQNSKIRSIITRIETPTPSAGPAYHPLPSEMEFECEPFWFPELHPLNRGHGMEPPDLAEQVAPVISPRVSVADFLATIEGANILDANWLQDPDSLFEPSPDVMKNYPFLLRYLMAGLDPNDIMLLNPTPLLADLGPLLYQPAARWWDDENGTERDTPEALEQLGSGLHDMLWDTRERGVELVKFRHMLYQTNIPLYILSYWFGATPELMQHMLETWIKETDPETADETEASALQNQEASAAEEELSEAEKAQLRAIEAMATARERNRLVAEQAGGFPEETAPRNVVKSL